MAAGRPGHSVTPRCSGALGGPVAVVPMQRILDTPSTTGTAWRLQHRGRHHAGRRARGGRRGPLARHRAGLRQDRQADGRPVLIADVPGDGRPRACRRRCTWITARTARSSTTASPPAGTRCCSTAPSCRSRRTCGRRTPSPPRRTRAARRRKGSSRRCPASRTAWPASTAVRSCRWTRRSPSSARPASTASRRPSARRTGSTRAAPSQLDPRVGDLVALEPVPLVLHGGTGLPDETFQELIRRGAPKVNISTRLKVTYLGQLRAPS